jgi:hypothetical protein
VSGCLTATGMDPGLGRPGHHATQVAAGLQPAPHAWTRAHMQCKRKASYEFEKHACMKWNEMQTEVGKEEDEIVVSTTSYIQHTWERIYIYIYERDRKSQPKRLALNFLSILHWSLIWTPRFDTNLMLLAVYFSLRSESEVIFGFSRFILLCNISKCTTSAMTNKAKTTYDLKWRDYMSRPLLLRSPPFINDIVSRNEHFSLPNTVLEWLYLRIEEVANLTNQTGMCPNFNCFLHSTRLPRCFVGYTSHPTRWLCVHRVVQNSGVCRSTTSTCFPWSY